MRKIYFDSNWLAVLLFVLVLSKSYDSLAQSSNSELRSPLPRQNNISDSETALVRVYVFKNNLPIEGVAIEALLEARDTVSANDRTLSTNQYGVADFLIPFEANSPQVAHFSLKVQTFNGLVRGRAVSGETTQVFVNLLPEISNSARDYSVETLARLEEPPNPEDSVKKLSDGPRQLLQIRIVSDENDQPIADARLFIQGISDSLVTDTKGVISAEIPLQSETLTVMHANFSTQTKSINPRLLKTGDTINIRLRPSATDLEDFVVLAPQMKGSVAALIEVRRKSSSVTEALGSEQMSKAGDGDAAASLRRVTGLTLVGGKFVYVRGLGERYSSTILNGASLPSPEPSRRVVPLDLFPTPILESMLIQKSYSPELPGEFGGGTIMMFAKGFPEKLTARFSVSTSLASSDGSIGYSGGNFDWLGVDDGTRTLPAAIREADRQGRKIQGGSSGLTDSELRDLGKAFANIWEARSVTHDPYPNLSFSLGGRVRDFGIQFSGLYGNDIDVSERETSRLVLDQGQLRVDSYSTTLLTEREIRAGLTGDLGYEIAPGQRLFINGILVRNTTDSTELKNGFSGNDFYRRTQLEWVERQIFQRQFRGEHKIGATDLNWRLTATEATRFAPDTRGHSYLLKGGEWTLSTSGDLYRNFSELTEQNDQMGIDFARTYNFDTDTQKQAQLKWRAGFDYLEKRRASSLRRFDFQEPGGQAGIDLTRPSEDIFSPDNFSREDGWTLRELTRATDSYRANQSITGIYSSFDLSPSKQWQLTAGARQEISIQDVVTFNLYDASKNEAKAGLESRDLLPVYAALWKFRSENQLRLTYAETLSRPDLKELSTAPYYDDESGQEVKGYPGLRGTVIRNWDLRWEWYPSADEIVSIAGFMKVFENPIELILIPQSSSSSWTFRNAKTARNIGIEIEARRSLRFIDRSLRRWSLGSNLALIDSRVQLDEKSAGILTSDDRPLQGQSPYVLNLQAFYDDKQRGLSAGLLYNVVGRRIREVASTPLPDVYEEAFNQLDFVSSLKIASQSFSSHLSLQFRIKNLLDPEVRLSQGDQVVHRYTRGRAFSIGMSVGI